MKINSKSRTYKFTRFYNFDQPHNLCQYTRQIIGATILTLCFISVLLYGFLIGLYPFYYPFDPTGSVGLAMTGILLDGVIVLLGYNTFRKFHKVPDVELPAPEYDSVLATRLRAAHDKVCPLIEVE